MGHVGLKRVGGGAEPHNATYARLNPGQQIYPTDARSRKQPTIKQQSTALSSERPNKAGKQKSGNENALLQVKYGMAPLTFEGPPSPAPTGPQGEPEEG